jgi:serine/threonine-protein kinase
LNELGKVAQKQGKLDLAKADFERMAKIYREVYNGKHYYIGIALSNLAGVYVDEKQYNQAEKLFREALQLYSETLPADHLNVGIAKIRLGRVLLRQRDYSKAQAETQAGYDIVQKQSDPPSNWIQSARKDLAEEFTALNQPQKAAEFLSSKTVSSK